MLGEGGGGFLGGVDLPQRNVMARILTGQKQWNAEVLQARHLTGKRKEKKGGVGTTEKKQARN